MAATVKEIMNHELFSLRPTDRCGDALSFLRTLGVHAAPIVDDDGRPMGMLSIWDLVGESGDASVAERMTRAPASVREDETVEAAAKRIGELSYHHLVVVDGDGKATGFLSAIDVIRCLMGQATRHPSTFPHFDAATGLVWTDDGELTRESIGAAPDAAGVYILIRTQPGVADTIVWADTSSNVRESLLGLLDSPGPLTREFEGARIRFRAAAAPDPEERKRAMSAIGDKILGDKAPTPS